MDIALIIGVIVGLAAMIGSIAYALFVEGSAGGFGDFISMQSFGIVFGGMIASIFVAFPMPLVAALGKAIGAVLKPADDKMGPLVDEACEIAEMGRKALLIWRKRSTASEPIFLRMAYRWWWMVTHWKS